MTQLTETEVQNLVQQGYCRTSLRHGLVSRIDRRDWKEHMTKKRSPLSVEAALQGMGSIAGAEDQYRRVYSRDTREVGIAVNQFPPSNGTVTGYRAKEAV